MALVMLIGAPAVLYSADADATGDSLGEVLDASVGWPAMASTMSESTADSVWG